MRTMTWEEIDKDWLDVNKRCKDYVRMEKAKAIARYCVGHSIHEVAARLDMDRRSVVDFLDTAGLAASTEGVALATSPNGGSDIRTSEREVIKQFAPTPEEESSDEFEPYLRHYEQDYGEGSDVAKRLARAEWAGEAAQEAGVIKEAKNKRDEKVNQILFPRDDKDTFELDLNMHMARVKSAAKFLDEAKVRNLRRKSTCEKVAEADELWRAQAELVLAHYQPS